MRSKYWECCKGATRNHLEGNFPEEELKTQTQWVKLKMLPISEESGKILWTNKHFQHRARYLFLDEVRPATAEEWESYIAPQREKRREQAKQRRAQEVAEQERLYQKLDDYHTKEFEWERLSNKAVAVMQDLCRRIAQSGTGEPRPHAETLVLHCQTTGLSSRENELLQVTMLDGEGRFVYQSYLKPLFLEEWAEAEAVNEITAEMVQDAPTIVEESPKIRAILQQAKRIVGYNLDLDLSFLKQWTGFSVRNTVESQESQETVNVMEEFAVIYGDWNDYHEDYTWQSLETCARYYGYEWQSAPCDSAERCRAILHCYRSLCEAEHQKH